MQELWTDLSQGGGRVLHYHGYSKIKALIDLYPELNFKRENFLRHKRLGDYFILSKIDTLYKTEEGIVGQ
jgi:hypothetical protein